MTFWQGLAITVLAETTDVGGKDAEEWAMSAQNFLICLEMLLFSIAHFYCFPTDEWEEDYKDHHPSHGHIQFVHGTASTYSATNFMVKPQVGDFYLFPSELFHCVYPFKTKGERRSFSVNFNFLEIPKKVEQENDGTVKASVVGQEG